MYSLLCSFQWYIVYSIVYRVPQIYRQDTQRLVRTTQLC